MVVSRQGRYRFQTGMVTASLLARGMPAAAAFALSRELRERISGRRQITTEELESVLESMLEELGYEGLMEQPEASGRSDIPLIRTPEGTEPIRWPRLLRDLVAVGMEPDQAVEVGNALELELRSFEGAVLARGQVDGALERLLLGAGRPYFHRYRLLQWIRRSDRPAVIFVGGATGTGKSTLAMEMAFRLGIRMVVSTDMIRETMRTVLSAEVVPGLHDHSFRGMLQGGQVLSDPQERVLAGFRQQAEQVAAGVRAVIRRALRENMHMIVEGTHLVPPFDRYLPEGGVYYAGLMLAVPRESEHRERFPRRAKRQNQRDPQAYLEAFQSVRWIHDDLLTAAEESEALVMPTGDIHVTATRTLDFLADVLPQGPVRARIPTTDLPDIRTLFVILDGLSDEPQEALGGLTPLKAARTPYLGMLAHVGGQGQVVTAPHAGEVPHTDEGLWSLLGTDPPKRRLGRGVVEAMGKGVALSPGAVLLRGNLATCHEDGSIVDRRAGRISSGQADLLAGLDNVPLSGGIFGSITPSLEHRVVVVLRGPGLSDRVSDTDPGQEGDQRFLQARPTDGTPEAARTASALRELLDIASVHLQAHPHNRERVAHGKLPANCILTRGAGSVRDIPPQQHRPDQAALVAACHTALGIARLAGMQAMTTPSMTGGLDTDLDAKFELAASLLETRSLVVVHVKGTDIAAHDRRPVAKRDLISRVDAALGRFLTSHGQVTDGLRVVVSADHGTSSRTGNHIADPVPVLVAVWSGEGEVADFDEETAQRGALGLLQPGDLARMLWTG